MAVIASFGDVAFEISDTKSTLLSDMNHSEGSRWEDHELSIHKPRSRFISADLIDYTFTIKLKAELGVNPTVEMEKLRKNNRNGVTSPFLIGNKPLSVNNFSIRRIDETFQHINGNGQITAIEAKITLKEYVIDNTQLKKTTTSNTTANAKSNTTAPAAKKATGTITITATTINIRNGPSMDAKILGVAAKNQKYTVYGTNSGFYDIGNGKYIGANSKYSNFKSG